MMLGEPDHVDPELVGEPSLAQRLVDHDAVAFEVAAIRKQKIAEFHITLFRDDDFAEFVSKSALPR
jgi:hypothetical protein